MSRALSNAVRDKNDQITKMQRDFQQFGADADAQKIYREILEDQNNIDSALFEYGKKNY